jgi:hypothetical protein
LENVKLGVGDDGWISLIWMILGSRCVDYEDFSLQGYYAM